MRLPPDDPDTVGSVQAHRALQVSVRSCHERNIFAVWYNHSTLPTSFGKCCAHWRWLCAKICKGMPASCANLVKVRCVNVSHGIFCFLPFLSRPRAVYRAIPGPLMKRGVGSSEQP